MSHIDDLRAVFAGKQPARVPVWELEFHAWDGMSGKHILLGEEFAALGAEGKAQALQTNAEIMMEIGRECHYAGLTIPGGYWYQAPGDLAYYVLPDDYRFRQCEVLRALAGEEFMLIGNAWGILGANYHEDYCATLYEEPEVIEAQARNAVQVGIDAARRWRDVGASAVFTPSDMADNSGPFYNPAQMAQLILPFLDQYADAVHAMGMFAILHSDGDLTRYLDMLADTRLDALQAVDTVAGMEMSAAQRIVNGRLALCGNVDCGLLLRGTPDEVYAATLALLRENAGGRLVLGASNAVQQDVPPENYRAMIAAWREY